MSMPSIMLSDGTVITFEMFTSMTEEEKLAVEEAVRRDGGFRMPSDD